MSLRRDKDKDKPTDEANTVEQAEALQGQQKSEADKIAQERRDRARLSQIRSRIKQQFQSPNSPYRGVTTSPEEERLIEDQARITLRKEKKAAIEHERA